MLLPSGDYLSGRVTLTNITKVSTTATLRFDNLECKDENDYICIIIYVNEFGGVIIDESTPTRILINAYSSIPDTISSFTVSTQITEKQENNLSNLLLEINTTLLIIKQNCSISYWSRPTCPNDLRNLIYLQSTKKPSTFFREGDTVVFTCTGNIGKPPGRLIWQKTSPQLEQPVIYLNETTNVQPIPDICSSKGTSNLTVLISADDLNAKYHCFEESQANIPEMYVETAPLEVHFHVRNIKITKQPNQTQYERNTAKIILTCNASGNPEPTYVWYKDDNTRCIIALTNFYIIEHVVKNNSGVYICEAYNSIDDIAYKANNSVEIDIEYAAYVIPVICVVVITMICFAVRKRHCKREKGRISGLLDASVIYAEVNEHTKLKYRLKNNQATSLNPEHADVEQDLMEGANEVSGDLRFKYNMITGKLEVYSNV
ncbi:CADM3 [Mytilus coruscus]|uniref:CADM3 n=1 Tax=Mytilus coruscus TaxID=42192 RepID=A0A6J8DKF3_MYTCO|nr:CADM3 [Mytilus coruscus]